MVKKVHVVYATVADGIVGICGHERLDLVELRFGEYVSPKMAELDAQGIVGKTLPVPQPHASSPTKAFGLVLSSRAVEEERTTDEQATFPGIEPLHPPVPPTDEDLGLL